MQATLDRTHMVLAEQYGEQRVPLGSERSEGVGGRAPASEKQLELIERAFPSLESDGLTKMQASMVLNRLFSGRRRRKVTA